VSEFTPQQQTWLERYIRLIAGKPKPAYEVSTDGLLLNGSITITTGTGTPEGAVTAPIGSIFLRDDGGASTTLYVKTSGVGSSGWTPK
jgi:hypothetical protein